MSSRGQMCCRCRSSWTLVSFVDQKRCSSRPFVDRPNYDLERFSSWPFVDKRKLQSPLQFSAALRVLRGQMCCRCRSSWTLVSFVDQKRCSSRPFVDRPNYDLERFSSWPFVDKRKLQSPLQFSAALRVLRGQMCCRCRSSWTLVSFVDQKRCSSRPFVDRPNYDLERFSSWPFVDKRKLQSPLQFSAALRVLRGQMCCRCRSSWTLVSFVDQKRCSSRPFVDRPNYDLERFSSCSFVDKKGFLLRPSWIDQTMTLQISVQKTVNEP